MDDHFQDQSQPQDTFKVWKLRGGCFDGRVSPVAAPLSVINTFTLQEALFIEQLTAIDERVRFQVREEKIIRNHHTEYGSIRSLIIIELINMHL